MQVAAGAGNPLNLLRRQIASSLNAPPTSSMGRLFDAVSSLLGIRHTANYEAQAAIELEALADPDETEKYSVNIDQQILDPSPMIESIIGDLRADLPIPIIAGRFHNAVAALLHQVCCEIRAEKGLTEIALSGGVWQNMTLLNKSVQLFQNDGFTVYLHRQVPANDGGIALGQAAIAMHKTNS